MFPCCFRLKSPERGGPNAIWPIEGEGKKKKKELAIGSTPLLNGNTVQSLAVRRCILILPFWGIVSRAETCLIRVVETTTQTLLPG